MEQKNLVKFLNRRVKRVKYKKTSIFARDYSLSLSLSYKLSPPSGGKVMQFNSQVKRSGTRSVLELR